MGAENMTSLEIKKLWRSRKSQKNKGGHLRVGLIKRKQPDDIR